ncbi:MAG: hypothetical protein DRH17_00930 [Deltaproteobacteria bacterium]|nr:MAG: hypothetical protein DRH17_00930 [Deltaproteobacteria bacterium]
MNILIIGNAYPPTYMGGESAHLYNLATSLKKRGHTIFVAHPAASTDGRTSIRLSRSGEGIHVYRLCLPAEDRGLERLNIMLMDIFQGLLEKGDEIDIIHCHSNKFSSSMEVLTKRYSVPLVTTIHAVHIAMVHDLIKRKGTPVDPHELALYTADTERQKAICAKSARIIAISRAMNSLVVKYFDADPQKVRHVYNGINFDRLANFSDQSQMEEIKKRLGIGDRTVILFAGRVEPVKGIQPLASACKTLCERYDQIAFIFLGNGSADTWLRSYLAECRNVYFIDWLSFDGVIPYYHLADIAVVPSLIEPFGLVVIESMACCTCVISSNADGLDEIITHNLNGVKIPLVVDEYGDRDIRAEDICSALERAICEPDWRQSLADQGVMRAKEFTLDHMAEEVEKVYSEL